MAFEEFLFLFLGGIFQTKDLIEPTVHYPVHDSDEHYYSLSNPNDLGDLSTDKFSRKWNENHSMKL